MSAKGNETNKMMTMNGGGNILKGKEWELERAKRYMAIIPSCDNCKYWSQAERRGETYCSKYKISYPVLCHKWFPAIWVIHDSADSRIKYIDLTKEQN